MVLSVFNFGFSWVFRDSYSDAERQLSCDNTIPVAGAGRGTPVRSEMTQGTVKQELLEPGTEHGQDYDSSVSWADDLEEMAKELAGESLL